MILQGPVIAPSKHQEALIQQHSSILDTQHLALQQHH